MSNQSVFEVDESLPDSNRDVIQGAEEILSEAAFRRVLCRERKRSERSGKTFVLMLVRSNVAAAARVQHEVLQRVGAIANAAIRETDLTGWFETNRTVGVIFAELGTSSAQTAVARIEAKMVNALQLKPSPSQTQSLQLSFYAFPDDGRDNGHAGQIFDRIFYPDLEEVQQGRKVDLIVKRTLDVIGSALALIACSPVFVVLAVAIKLTSEGPVFFRQQRVGERALPFVLLKFRSMRVATDPAIHREYVRNFIAGKVEAEAAKENCVYKITNDPRITWIGKVMRRASLDELPQFWNVLLGDMSLVGPRPPIPYETEAYAPWHRRRFLEVKPGITGLWQVRGRSRTTFDEMVRLDLEYAKSWSPVADLRILLQTPRAVLSGDGAY
jgi:lipopolysaccharide/colanic/teichoic acid biosynthesis glycosyltransferase